MGLVAVTNLRTATLEGVVVGSVVDLCRNFQQGAGPNQARAADILAALEAWRDGVVAERNAAADARVATLQATVAQKDARITTLQGLVDAMGGTELGRQLARQKRREEALAAKLAAEAEIAAIDAEQPSA